jgi:hypothetical protein
MKLVSTFDRHKGLHATDPESVQDSGALQLYGCYLPLPPTILCQQVEGISSSVDACVLLAAMMGYAILFDTGKQLMALNRPS